MVWVIALNRPEKKNALNEVMVSELHQALKLASEDQDCRAVVIKGGNGVFCAGADLQYLQKLQDYSFDENVEDSMSLAGLFHTMYTFPKLLITQVEGPALAGGCGLATIGDFCFATPDSTFGYTEARIGFIPAIVMIFLIRKVGDQRARELMLTADIIDANKAQHYGLVYEVVEQGAVDDRVAEFIQQIISRNSAQSLRAIKEMMAEIQNMNLDDALNYAGIMNAKTRETDDCKKGIAAFLNKEKPEWI